MYRLFCVALCIVCVYMCTELLPLGGYPIAVKYIISYHKKFSNNHILNLNQHIFSSSLLHVSTIYGHHQAGHKKGNKYTVLDSFPLKMGPIDYPQTLVNNRHCKLCNFPDERRSHVLCGGRLKSCKVHSYDLFFIVPTRAFHCTLKH
jgi:hypothetical protein